MPHGPPKEGGFCGCSRKCCATSWGVAMFLGMLLTAAVPWYAVDREFGLHEGTSLSKCKVTLLIGWKEEYCKTSCKGPNDGCPHSDMYNWRNLCADTSGVVCKNRRKIFNTAAGLMGVALVFAFVSCLGFIYRGCRASYRKSKFLIATVLLATFFLAMALGVFASEFPDALQDDDYLCTSDGKGPCADFFGTKRDEDDEITYGGAGWIAGMITFVISLFASCLSCFDYDSAVLESGYLARHGGYDYGDAPEHLYTTTNDQNYIKMGHYVPPPNSKMT